MAKNSNWLAIAVVVAIGAVVLVVTQAGNLSGAATLGTSGVSSRELPKGICVVEVDEVVGGFGLDRSIENLNLVITESGRKPAFAKVQSLWMYGTDEFGDGPLPAGASLSWHGEVQTKSRTLTGIRTGVPDKTAFFYSENVFVLDGDSGPFAVDLVANADVGMESNGIPIASQGSAGEVVLPLAAAEADDEAWNLHIAAVIESPVGNLCSINLVPRGLSRF